MNLNRESAEKEAGKALIAVLVTFIGLISLVLIADGFVIHGHVPLNIVVDQLIRLVESARASYMGRYNKQQREHIHGRSRRAG